MIMQDTAPPAQRQPFLTLDGRWISPGLGLAFVVVLGLPLLVTVLWPLVDPKVGWLAPDVVPRSLALDHWQTTLRNPRAWANSEGLT